MVGNSNDVAVFPLYFALEFCLENTSNMSKNKLIKFYIFIAGITEERRHRHVSVLLLCFFLFFQSDKNPMLFTLSTH